MSATGDGDDDVFAKPHLKGARFSRPQIPVEVLPALEIYRDLVFAIARALVIKRGGRKQAPKGFAKNFTLLLDRIEDGSAVPVLIKQLATNPEGWSESYDDAREVVSDAITAINGDLPLPPDFPKHLLQKLAQLGGILQKGESLELETPTRLKKKPAVFSGSTKEKLIARSAQPVAAKKELHAAVFAVDAQRKTLKGKLPSGNVFKLKYEKRVEPRVVMALKGRSWLRTSFSVIAMVDAIGTVVEVTDVLKIELWTRSSEEAVRSVEERVEGLGLLIPRARDEFGIAQREFEWAKDVLLSLMVDQGFPEPSIFPSPGGLRFEWTAKQWDLSLDVALPARSAYFHALNLETEESHDREFALGDLATHDREQLVTELEKYLRAAPKRSVGDE